jgi:predicted Rossmann fold nucleotide-binding protein DprA/Smf involved in DNA uptake
VEASEKGGTLAAGTKALQLNKPVLALEFAMNPRGNAELIRHGAISIRNRAELHARLMEVAENPQGNQLSIILWSHALFVHESGMDAGISTLV